MIVQDILDRLFRNLDRQHDLGQAASAKVAIGADGDAATSAPGEITYPDVTAFLQ